MKKIRYCLMFTVWYLLSLLPLWVLYRIADLLCPIVHYVVHYRRKVIQKNLKESFPDKTDKELSRIERDFYRFFCDYIVETVKLFSLSKRSLRKRMTFEGLDELDKAFHKEGHNFCFVYLGHYGNWEWIASLPYFMPKDVLCAQIYHPLWSPVFDSLFLRLRNRFGGECIPMKLTLRRIIKLRQEKRKTVVGFISDQLPNWNSMHFFVPFLNHPDTPVFTGTEQIGRQMDAAFFFAHISRPKRGRYVCTFKRMNTPANSLPDEYPMTTLFSRLLEQMINEQPSIWLWSHKRWKRTKAEWLIRKQKEGKL
ncbi:MAG: lysophospholipid acyltransferase family protein [Clostridium sp.]|nr:lysophospholipid acyltransferase family protein [Clostridium sp.]